MPKLRQEIALVLSLWVEKELHPHWRIFNNSRRNWVPHPFRSFIAEWVGKHEVSSPKETVKMLQRPESEVRIKIICHPQRSLPRFVRQTESKDLRLFFNELQIHHTGGISALKQPNSTKNAQLPSLFSGSNPAFTPHSSVCGRTFPGIAALKHNSTPYRATDSAL